MFGLIVLLILVVYGALMISAVVFGWRRGRRNGGSIRKATIYGTFGFLVVYLPVFWNHIPVLLRHQWLCARDGGYTQYVDPSLWRAANATKIESMSSEQRRHEARVEIDGWHAWRIFGGLLESRRRSEESRFLQVPIIRTEVLLLEASNRRLLARKVNFHLVGSGDDIRSWIFPSSCRNLDSELKYPIEQYLQKLKGE